jgi:peroxiredoxin
MTMHRLIAFALLALLAAGCSEEPTANAQERAVLALGATAPSRTVRMKNVDGREITIDSVRGRRGTLVIFTCNHCPYAQRWESRIVTLGNRFREQGVGVIAVNPNDPTEYPSDAFEPMQARAREAGMQFPYVVDATSDVARAYGATRTPEAFLFDARWRLVYHGAIDDNASEPDQVQSRYLEDALTAVAAGRAPAVAQSRAVGCSIKFRE